MPPPGEPDTMEAVLHTGVISKDEISMIRKSATDYYEKDCFAYKTKCLKGDQKADFQWMEKMMKVGTLPDKMAAYVVKIQDSPIHNLQHLQNLLSLVKTQSKQQCLMAADTLKDLFLENLLPKEKKLIPFEKRGMPLKLADSTQLIQWIYEDRLKSCYENFVHSLKQMSLDTVDKIRAKAILIIYQLLTKHPEQEAELLQLLVNKLGDPVKKVGSRVLFYLNSLLHAHPRMKLVVIDEVERLLFRNNIAKKAQYYGICFLTSINLEDEHPEVACKLINVYVAFFKGCIKTGDIETKMMSALLTGINKSYPSAKEFGFKLTENMDTLYKITHLSNFSVSIQALSILFQLTDIGKNSKDADRYYRVLYTELLRPEVSTTSHILQFLNLIFKSMKCDNQLSRVMGFCKRLLQICQEVQPNLACAILVMISEVSKTHSGMIKLGSNPVGVEEISDDDDDDDDEVESRNEKIDNLVKISNVKVIDNIEDTPKICLKPQEASPKEDNDNKGNISVVNLEKIVNLEEETEKEIKLEYKHPIKEYDSNARNPTYSGAEFSLAHEVATLACHYHPSVALYAETLLQRKHIKHEGNPLKDFTITRFLERFVYRNSKKSKFNPGVPRTYHPKGLRNVPVNSAEYLSNSEECIPVDEKFFYRYFKEKKPAQDDNESDTESVGDDEFDSLMANYFKSVKGNVFGADEDIDDDFDFAGDIHKKPKKLKNEDSDEEDDDEEKYDDESTEEFGPAEDADELLDLDDEDMDMDMDDDDDDFEEEDGLEVLDFDEPVKNSKRRKKDVDMFAPAEQFSEMLEANADVGLSGPNTLINRDNADPKQLKWEMDRERRMKGNKRNFKSNFKNKRRYRHQN